MVGCKDPRRAHGHRHLQNSSAGDWLGAVLTVRIKPIFSKSSEGSLVGRVLFLHITPTAHRSWGDTALVFSPAGRLGRK